MTKTIDEILRNVATMKDPRAEKEAKAAIEAMLRDIIGQDEKLDMGGSYEAVQRHNVSFDRNKLREELRQRATKYNLDI
jgi:hypothetical protein